MSWILIWFALASTVAGSTGSFTSGAAYFGTGEACQQAQAKLENPVTSPGWKFQTTPDTIPAKVIVIAYCVPAGR